MSAQGTTHITGIGTVLVPVAGQERALDFYVGTLGFEKRLDAPFGDDRWIEVAPHGPATRSRYVPPMFTFRDPDGNRFRVVQRD